VSVTNSNTCTCPVSICADKTGAHRPPKGKITRGNTYKTHSRTKAAELIIHGTHTKQLLTEDHKAEKPSAVTLESELNISLMNPVFEITICGVVYTPERTASSTGFAQLRFGHCRMRTTSTFFCVLNSLNRMTICVALVGAMIQLQSALLA